MGHKVVSSATYSGLGSSQGNGRNEASQGRRPPDRPQQFAQAATRRESLEGALFSAYPSSLATHFETFAELEQDGIATGERLAEVLVSFDQNSPEETTRDAWAMRAELMRLPETNGALLGFLNRWGVWSAGELTRRTFRFK